MDDGKSLRLLSTLAVMGALRALGERLDAAAGVPVLADFAPTLALLDRLRAGAPADVVILTREGLDALAAEGLVVPASRVDIALSRVGIAVRAGAPKPDITTPAALRAALLAARAVAYSRIGASGLLFKELLVTLGIADAVNARARIIPAGFTAALAASGEADLAVQQISELLVVPGIEVVGPLPAELQVPAMFSAGQIMASTGPAAERLLRFLMSAEAAGILVQAGLEPCAAQPLRILKALP